MQNVHFQNKFSMRALVRELVFILHKMHKPPNHGEVASIDGDSYTSLKPFARVTPTPPAVSKNKNGKVPTGIPF